jgi:hypothetical protein
MVVAQWKVSANTELLEPADRYVMIKNTNNLEICLSSEFWINEDLDKFSLFVAMENGYKNFKEFTLFFSPKYEGNVKFVPFTVGASTLISVYIPKHILVEAITELKIIKSEYDYFNNLDEV